MDSYVLWWIAAFVLVVAELLTGTFYLLVVAIGLACGGVVAWLSATATMQFVVAAFVGLAGVVLLNRWKQRQPAPPATEAGLDIGASVHVEQWNEDGSARVQYRGSLWDARLGSPDTPRATTLYIIATEGSTLILGQRDA